MTAPPERLKHPSLLMGIDTLTLKFSGDNEGVEWFTTTLKIMFFFSFKKNAMHIVHPCWLMGKL